MRLRNLLRVATAWVALVPALAMAMAEAKIEALVSLRANLARLGCTHPQLTALSRGWLAACDAPLDGGGIQRSAYIWSGGRLERLARVRESGQRHGSVSLSAPDRVVVTEASERGFYQESEWDVGAVPSRLLRRVSDGGPGCQHRTDPERGIMDDAVWPVCTTDFVARHTSCRGRRLDCNGAAPALVATEWSPIPLHRARRPLRVTSVDECAARFGAADGTHFSVVAIDDGATLRLRLRLADPTAGEAGDRVELSLSPVTVEPICDDLADAQATCGRLRAEPRSQGAPPVTWAAGRRGPQRIDGAPDDAASSEVRAHAETNGTWVIELRGMARAAAEAGLALTYVDVVAGRARMRVSTAPDGTGRLDDGSLCDWDADRM